MASSSHSTNQWENYSPWNLVELPASPASDVDSALVQAALNVVSPYTPAPSPQPLTPPIDSISRRSSAYDLDRHDMRRHQSLSDDADDQSDFINIIQSNFSRLNLTNRTRILADLLSLCDNNQLGFISNLIAPRLKRDFLRELPVEVSLHILGYIDDPRTLARAACVSRFWNDLLADEYTWKTMCIRHNFGKSMMDAYRSAMEGNITWEARNILRSSSSTDALTSAMEAAVVADDSRMNIDDDSESELTVTSGVSTIESSSQAGAANLSAARHSISSIKSNTGTRSSGSWSNAVTSGSRRLSLGLPAFEVRRSSKLHHSLRLPAKVEEQFSYKRYFKLAYLTEAGWRRGGRVLKSHTSADDGVVTSVAMNDDWIVAGLVNHRIHVFAADTGAHVRTLVGHTQGVWCLVLVTRGGSPAAATYASDPKWPQFDPNYSLSTPTEAERHNTFGSLPNSPIPSVSPFSGQLRPTDVGNAAVGWGQQSTLVVSGGCDRDLRVWDVATGHCLQSLKGHTSTIRCLKVLDGRPIAVSGSRDCTLRVWDIQKGRCLQILSGHTGSVRSLDIAGNIAISGSYDCTARMWNVDSGECLRIFEGHYHQIYAVAFDGIRVASGSLDSTVRIWSAETGACLVTLQGHTSLVGQLQFSGDVLISGGSDGRVIIFSLKTGETRARLCAHDNSVTCLQFDDRFLITGGNDGHVKLFEVDSGAPIRELTEPCDAVWRVAFRKDKCVIMLKRGGKTVMEILSFRPPEEAL